LALDKLQFEVEEYGYKWNYTNELNSSTMILIDTKRIYQAIRIVIGNAIKYGANDYMTKPFSPSELVARIKLHITRYEKLLGINNSVSVFSYKGLEKIQAIPSILKLYGEVGIVLMDKRVTGIYSTHYIFSGKISS